VTHTTALPAELSVALETLAQEAISSVQLMDSIAALLHDRLPNYNWVGFYLLERDAGGEMLVLGPFRGAATPHTRIPLNQGICGAAAAGGQTLVVDDVNADPRYLACSLETRSEIVVPVFAKGQVVGELDIDSHVPSAFGVEDRALCEHAAKLVGDWLDRQTG
jgi:L-methionine (R)-S-oxide reductase